MARRAGDLPEVRPGRPQLHRLPALAEVGLRVNEACKPGLPDVKWELGRFGKLHVRHGKGARGSGPRERMVPLINNAGQTLRWFAGDVWGQFGDDHTRPRPPGRTCRTGPTWSPPTSFAISAPASSAWAAWT